MAKANLLFSLDFIYLFEEILAAPWPRPFMPIAVVKPRNFARFGGVLDVKKPPFGGLKFNIAPIKPFCSTLQTI